MLRSPVITKLPTWPHARQCVPPHSSWLKPSTRIVRTLSPYFSSKNASAPAACASAIVIHSIADRAVLADDPPHLGLDRALLVVGQRAVEREVEAQVVGVHERARLAAPGRRRRCAAPGGAGACPCGCASCRRGARHRLGRRRVSPTATVPCRTPRCTVRPAVCVPATRWTSSTSNSTRAIRRPQDADVRHLAAALGVERRPVEHDLGARGRLGAELDLRHRLERLVLHAVAEDRDHPRIGRRRVVAQELGRARPREQRVVQRRAARPSSPGRPWCPRGSGRAARRARRRTRRGRPARRTRPRARR